MVRLLHLLVVGLHNSILSTGKFARKISDKSVNGSSKWLKRSPSALRSNRLGKRGTRVVLRVHKQGMDGVISLSSLYCVVIDCAGLA
jgi:hypothetical protein